jgi:hypothetical protein
MEEKTYKSIDKSIYEHPDIRKRLRPILWAWACAAIGAGGFALNKLLPHIGQGMSSLIAGLLVIGVFGIATIVCYYIFGDCKAPYYKPLHRLLTREYFFYSNNEREELFRLFEAKDMTGIDKIKKSAAPALTLVRYSDKDEKFFFAQIFENKNGKDIPVTETKEFRIKS